MNHRVQADCRSCIAGFPDMEAGELSSEETHRFQQHLEGCPDCSESWSAFRKAVQEAGRALNTSAPEGAPDDYWDTFLPRLRDRIGRETARPSRTARPVWALPAAAALVLGFCLGALAGTAGGLSGTPTRATVTPRPVQDSSAEPSYAEQDLFLPLLDSGETGYAASYDELEALDDDEIDLLVRDLLGDIS